LGDRSLRRHHGLAPAGPRRAARRAAALAVAGRRLQPVDDLRRLHQDRQHQPLGTLDHATMGLLEALRARIETRLAAAGLAVTGEEYLHSYSPDHSEPGSKSY